MIAILSPAKTLDMKVNIPEVPVTIPGFLPDSEELVRELRKLGPRELSDLMQISPALARENVERYTRWSLPFTPDNSRPAILAFKGEVYRGLKSKELDTEDLVYAADHIRILSGLYGILCPLDLMQAYRLEMGTALENSRGKDLYAFWGDKLTKALMKDLESSGEAVLVNLASQEYFRSLDPKKMSCGIITPEFKESRGGSYRMVTVYAKKARGMMARFMVKNRIEKAEDLKHFEEEGYQYNDKLSGKDKWVFTR